MLLVSLKDSLDKLLLVPRKDSQGQLCLVRPRFRRLRQYHPRQGSQVQRRELQRYRGG